MNGTNSILSGIRILCCRPSRLLPAIGKSLLSKEMPSLRYRLRSRFFLFCRKAQHALSLYAIFQITDRYRKITILFLKPIRTFLPIISSFPFIGRVAYRRKYPMQKPFIHDPAIYKDPVTGRYYIYATHAEGYVSDDLLHWNSLGQIAAVLPEAREWTGGTDIWAPDIVKVGNEYRLYSSNSTWGVQLSCIFLAVSDQASGPFIPKAPVLKTSDALPVNRIDANIITDVRTGDMYMLYGSFWGGSHMLRLDPETGLAAKESVGTCVCRKPSWLSTAVEGPYMIYNRETDYYYLFVSCGSLKTDYNIRVGRSRNILGPFYDIKGKCLTEDPDVSWNPGFLIIAGYTWNKREDIYGSRT